VSHLNRSLPSRPCGLLVVAAVVGALVMAPATAWADDSTAAATASTGSVGADPAATSVAPSPVDEATTAPETSTVPEMSAAPETSAAPVTSAAPTSGPVPPGLAADASPGTTVVGKLVQVYYDPPPGMVGDPVLESTPLSWVQTASGEAYRIPTDDVSDVPRGTTVAVTVGDRVEDSASVLGLEPAHEVASADVVGAATTDRQSVAQATATVNHPVTVVMMQPAGVARDDTTLSAVQNAVNGPVADFWSQQTGGEVRLGVVAGVDWFQGSATCSDPFALWSEAAAKAGWTYGPGKHLLVYVPYGAPDCSYGLGEVRQNTSSGGRLYVQATATSVIAHELGHNFGLNHSSELQCTGTVEKTSGSTCQVTAYNDYYDVMGVSWGQVGTLSALQAAQLGVLPADQQVDVTGTTPSTSYSLSPISGSSGTRALRITAGDGSRYWVEYRPGSGQDSWLQSRANVVGIQAGVLVRRENPGSGDSSLLLDVTPSAAAGWARDVATVLPLGEPVALAGGAFTLTLRSSDAGTAVVGVATANKLGVATANNLPVGSWDSVSVSGSQLVVRGWALDPDDAAVSSQVHVYVDGVGVSVTADGSRPDVAAVFPGAGAAHGFSVSRSVAAGSHSVCVFAIDVDFPSRNSLLGCRTISSR